MESCLGISISSYNSYLLACFESCIEVYDYSLGKSLQSFLIPQGATCMLCKGKQLFVGTKKAKIFKYILEPRRTHPNLQEKKKKKDESSKVSQTA